MNFTDPDSGEQVELENFTVEVDSSEQGELISGLATYRLERVSAGGQSYGPGQVGLEVSQLSAAAIVQLQESMEQIQRQPLDDEQRGIAIMGTLMGLGPQLLSSDPGFAIRELRVATPSGEVTGGFSVRPVGLRWSEIGNIGVVLDKLTAEFSLRVPEALFEQLQRQQIRMALVAELARLAQQGQQPPELDPVQLQLLVEQQAQERLAQWLEQGVVERVGSDITTQANLASGLLTVNGKAFPLATLLQ